jgi:hypothetical protein
MCRFYILASCCKKYHDTLQFYLKSNLYLMYVLKISGVRRKLILNIAVAIKQIQLMILTFLSTILSF